MKRVLALMVMAVFMLPLTASADDYGPFYGYLHKSSDSGNTTAASGASPMVIEGGSLFDRSEGEYTIEADEYGSDWGPWWTVQVLDLDSSIAQQALGGTISKEGDPETSYHPMPVWSGSCRALGF